MSTCVKITDFVEDLNYKGIVLLIDKDSVVKDDLKAALERDEVNKIWRLDNAWKTGMFTVENCDLDDVPNLDYLDGGGYAVFSLVEDVKGEFYIQVPSTIEWWVKENRLVDMHDSRLNYLRDCGED